MHQVAIAFYWHQHQPYYPDDVTGENPMPWVRLHGVKDYWGMAMHLKEVPEMHATINLVPSLLAQLTAYTEQGRDDAHLRVSRLPADSLSEEDLHYLLDNFFLVHADQMIRPYPRYWELYQQRGWGVDSAQAAARRFRPRDILDLQVWSNLTWIHPIAFEQDRDLHEFRRKGSGWTEDEKLWLLDKQMEILRQVIPLHRELARNGQVELTTSPFYHPILPLLYDQRLARVAMPDVDLPRHLESYAEDAAWHIRAAIEMHERHFGGVPRGMWPSEGSVCQQVIPDIAEAGVQWIATDEEILSCSTNGWVSRDAAGHLRNPEMLYRPWRVEEQGRQLQIIFRDHAMSDLIGFHYQRYAADAAVEDFLGKLSAIGHATRANREHRPTLVSVILDGENCWEYYPGGGVEFLRSLYRQIAGQREIVSTRICDYLERYPAVDHLGHLFPGSWISHNFGIWIGHHECNRAWDLLAQTRAHLLDAERRGHGTSQMREEAWRELHIAEGSDWFWWFGDDHNSGQDGLFDQLFRKHLQNVYLVLGETPPVELSRPISAAAHGKPPHYTEPNGLLQVKVDGRLTYFEWISAGHVVHRGARGTMSMASERVVSDLYYGFDLKRLMLRIDTHDGPACDRLSAFDTLRVDFLEPKNLEILVVDPSAPRPVAQLYQDEIPVHTADLEVATGTVFELAVSWESLGVAAEEPVYFLVELLKGDQTMERVPIEGAIETRVPCEDYEQIMWQV